MNKKGMGQLKKVIVLVIALAIITCSYAMASEHEIKINVDGKTIEFTDSKPFINEDNRTMIPVAKVADTLGANVAWDGEARTVKIVKGDIEIILKIDSNIITANGKEEVMDTKAIIIEGRTYVPISFIAKQMGEAIEWNNETKTVYIGSRRINSINFDDKTNYNVRNIGNYSMFNTDGEYLYFVNIADARKLYKAPLNNIEKKEKIFDERGISYINVIGDKIVFSYYSGAAVGVINKDGTDFKTIDIVPYRISSLGDKIICINSDPSNSFNRYIYSIDLDGGNVEILQKGGSELLVLEEYIISNSNREVYKINHNGTNKEVLFSAGKEKGFNYYEDSVYYTVHEEYNNVYEFNLKLKSKEKHTTKNKVYNYTIYDNFIYYTDGESGVYKYNKDTAIQSKIIYGEVVNLNIIGDYIFAYNANSGDIIYQYNLISEELQEYIMK